jgi:CDGSH-type Zn-finger protein
MGSIKAWQNGPYLVEGDDVTVLDWNGHAYQIPGRPFALCRCGGSAKKPFCDGTHSTGCRQVAECQRSLELSATDPQAAISSSRSR